MNNIELIKELRDATGFSFNEIKKALEEAGGDKVRALEILKAHGAEIAEKKSSRTTNEGVIESYIHSNKKVGSIVSLYCETDFVARNPQFIQLAHDVAMQVASMKPKDLKELLGQPFIKDQDITIQELINQHIAKLGENIKVGGFSRMEI